MASQSHPEPAPTQSGISPLVWIGIAVAGFCLVGGLLAMERTDSGSGEASAG